MIIHVFTTFLTFLSVDFVIRKMNFRIYFGGWPEWVVRAPDDLKILGDSIHNTN